MLSALSIKERFSGFCKEQDVRSVLLILFAFSLPLSVALCNILATLIFLHFVFFAGGTVREKLKIFIANRLSVALLAYVVLHVLGILWSPVPGLAVEDLWKNIRLLLIPVFAYNRNTGSGIRVLASFVTAMLISNFIASAYCLGLLHPVGGVASIRETWISDIMSGLFPFLPMETSIINLGGAPFINRVHFSPLLAFAMSVILFYIPVIKGRKLKIFALVISFSFLYSLIETEGRTGQILFLFFLLSGIMYKYRSWKSFFLAGFFIVVSLLLLYSFSGRFYSRVNDIFRGWDSFQQGEFGYGIGDRLIYTVSGWKLFLESPVFGHGTSSFAIEYARIKAKLFPDTLDSGNPHSQYILVLVQFGLLGLVSLLWIFYEGFCIFKRRFSENVDFYNLCALWLLLMYLLTGFVGTCLWDSPLQHFFILFVSVFFFRETERTFHVTSGR